MNLSPSERRKIENEAAFRKHNEKIQKGRDHINTLAKEDNQIDLIDDTNLLLQYVCECSDENCTARIGVLSDDYNEIHENRKWFVIANGHETLEVETIVEQKSAYTIVEKIVKPSEVNPKLSETDADNS